MFLTRVLAAKSKYISVMCESMVTGHKAYFLRERKGDKLEIVWFDPYVRQKVIYKEVKKLKGVDCKNYKPNDTLEALDM